MGYGRKNALQRLKGLRPRVEEHLREIARMPEHREVHHWRMEVRNWLSHMEAMLRHLGEKTAGEWAQWIEKARARLEVNA
jgi:hypothetical protein